MAYSENILPKSGAYYTLSRASVEGTSLNVEAGGYAEINISKQMLPSLTSKMLVVVHPSVFSSSYSNDAIQVNLSVITSDGDYIEFLIPVCEHSSGVFNTEITLPEGDYVLFTYRISSVVPVTIYNWELCAEAAADMTAIIDGVEQTIPKLLYDYNTYSYAVAQQELTIGLISCYLLAATDLQGHFTFSFFATERCNVHVRIKDNHVTELFSPQVYTVEKGYASISIPHAYLKKMATDHAFSVTVQCSNGQLSVPVRGVLYTIDGGYLATRLLDAGIDVEDISIRQLETDTSPSEIWAVGFEGNRLLLKSREYSEVLRANWTAIKDFGEGLKACVEFTGQWLNRNNSDKFTLETEATPFVLILGVDNVLKSYYGSSFDITLNLDDAVTDVSACQGYNSMLDINQNQGLIVAYVKNGNVYYRQWLYNEDIDGYMWYPAETLYEGGDAEHVNVHRLPDYRVGICVQNAAETKWYITERTYISQAVKPEIISTMTDSLTIATVIDASRTSEASGVATLNTFEESEDNLYNGFILTFVGDIVLLKGRTLNDFISSIIVTVDGVTLDSTAIESIVVEGNTITVTLVDSVPGGSVVGVNLNFIYIAIRQYNNCLMETTQAYSWSLPIPTIRTTFNDSVNISATASVDCDVKQLITTNINANDNVAVTASASVDCDVTQLTTEEIAYSDTASISISSATVNVAVTLVGTSPI